MTTRAEEIAAEGPYRVVYSEEKSAFRIEGPTPHEWNYSEERSPKEQADKLNAAYKQGRQDRWIPVSEERQPERNTMAIYWTPGLDGTIESGYPAIADEWRWEHHGQYATHYLDFSTPNPEQR